jgi:alpha-glucuronidase
MIRILLLYCLAITILFVSCTGNEKNNLPNDALNSLSSLIPIVKKTSLSEKSFSFSGEWRIDVVSDSVVYNSLKDGLQVLIADGRISLNEKAGATIKFILKPGSVAIDQGIDTNKTSLEEQAYELRLDPKEIIITANASQGLYYGVQTFLQLIQSQKGDISLPEGEIRDWPDLAQRMIYWDDAHHLEKFEAVKRIILQTALIKRQCLCPR